MVRSSFFGLEIGKSALTMSQLGLDVTGHNIANVDTKGYTRQRIINTAYDPFSSIGRALPVDQARIGGGVKVLIHDQIRSAYLDNRYRVQNTLNSYWQKRTENLSYLESYFDNLKEETSINYSISRFFEAISVVATDPVEKAQRKLLQTAGLDLVKQLNTIYAGLIDLQDSQNLAIKTTVEDINRMAKDIVELNKAIYGFEVTGHIALDLRDKRNALLDDLSAIIPIEYREYSDGRGNNLLEVKIGGEVLVDHDKYYELDVRETANVIPGENPVWEAYWKTKQVTDSGEPCVLYIGKMTPPLTVDPAYIAAESIDMNDAAQVAELVKKINALATQFNGLYVQYDPVNGIQKTVAALPTAPTLPAVVGNPTAVANPGRTPTLRKEPVPPKVVADPGSVPPNPADYTGGATDPKYIKDLADYNIKLAAWNKYNTDLTAYNDDRAAWLTESAMYESNHALWLTTYNAQWVSDKALYDQYLLDKADYDQYVKDKAAYDRALIRYNNDFEKAEAMQAIYDDDFDEAVDILKELRDILGDATTLEIDCEQGGTHAFIRLNGYIFACSKGCVISNEATFKVHYTQATKDREPGALLVEGGELLAFLQMRDSYDVHTPGIPYYIEMLNNLSRAFVQEINAVHREGWTEDVARAADLLYSDGTPIGNGSVQGVDFFWIDFEVVMSGVADTINGYIDDILSDIKSADSPLTSAYRLDPASIDDPYYDKVFNSVYKVDGFIDIINSMLNAYENGVDDTYRIDAGNTADPYYSQLSDVIRDENNLYSLVTAKNISLSEAVMASEYNIACSTSQIDKSRPDGLQRGNNENMNLLYELFLKTNIKLPNGLDIGSFDGYATGIRFDVANTLSFAKKTADNFNVLTIAAENQRLAVSGVSLDEEMTNLIKYQHAYNGAARVITAMDDALDVLINRTGRVGL